MNSKVNYYEVLGCDQNATVEEIKRKYRTKVLTSHPDKHSAESDKSFTGDFDTINKAWDTLRDPEKRKVYDAQLKNKDAEEQFLVYETVTKDSLTFNYDCHVYSYQCRCGGEYKVNASDVIDEQTFSVECDSCSLLINVIN